MAVGLFVNHRIAQVKRNSVGTELFDRRQRILGDEDRVAGVEIRSDKFLARGFDHRARFPRLQFLVILDPNLDAGIERLGANLAQDADCGFDRGRKRAFGELVAIARQQCAHDGRAHS